MDTPLDHPALPDPADAPHRQAVAGDAAAGTARPEPCPNCGEHLPVPAVRHCPSCGQETHLHPPSFGEFVHEFVGHYIALEGALWKTLALLLFRPGRLTIEYLRGRRRRYVLPLRVYLSASFLFFLSVKVMGVGGITVAQSTSAVEVDPQSRQELQQCAEGADCNALEQRLSRLALKMQGNAGPQAFGQARDQMLSWAPYAMFAMQPIYAALAMLAWRARRLKYGVHFVFSLHVHAFWFLTMLAMAVLPDALGSWLLLAMAAYTIAAMRTVYDSPWRTAVWRGLSVMMAYGFLLLLLTAGALAAALLR
jgi:Protein of unknown function (DUF3667)